MKITIDYEQIFEECKSLLRSIDIPIDSDDRIFISFSLKNSHHAEAFCSHSSNGHEIRLKEAYITAKNPDIKHFKNLLMHELVHTCPDCLYGRKAEDHSSLFLSYAKKIFDSLNYNILEFEDLPSYKSGNIPIKVVGHCKHCGCSIIFRNDKNIEKDFFARLVYTHDEVASPCPYCRHLVQYTKND